MNKRQKKKKLKQKGGVPMRTLEEIRIKNKRSDLLNDGMESTPVCIPHDLAENEKSMYEDFIKPHVEDFLLKHFQKGQI